MSGAPSALEGLGRSTRTGACIGVGGLLMLAGSQLHPREAKATVDQTLEGYFQSSSWDISHLLLLAGTLVALVGLVFARRDQVFDVRLRRQFLITPIAWGLAALELVPHLLARHDLHALQHGGETSTLDLHLALSAAATPLFGITSALLAIALAVTGRTWPAVLLSIPGVVGGVAYTLAGPLIYVTENVAFAPLFAGQALVSLFLIGTGIRVLAARRRQVSRARERDLVRTP